MMKAKLAVLGVFIATGMVRVMERMILRQIAEMGAIHLISVQD